MSQRKSVSGRPMGTDGSDFSYRMVVNSRYQKVAEGEIGRKRSRSFFLKLYLFGSSIAAVASVAFLVKSEKLFELIEDFSKWETSMAKMFKVAAVLLEVIVQIVTIGVTSSLMRNMAPPKRAS